MATFKGVADITRDYQKSIQPCDYNEPVNLEGCWGGGGYEMGWRLIARLTAHGDLPKAGLRAFQE
jgi:hypothetical protein